MIYRCTETGWIIRNLWKTQQFEKLAEFMSEDCEQFFEVVREPDFKLTLKPGSILESLITLSSSMSKDHVMQLCERKWIQSFLDLPGDEEENNHLQILPDTAVEVSESYKERFERGEEITIRQKKCERSFLLKCKKIKDGIMINVLDPGTMTITMKKGLGSLFLRELYCPEGVFTGSMIMLDSNCSFLTDGAIQRPFSVSKEITEICGIAIGIALFVVS